MNPVYLIFFISESFHIIGHAVVLFRIRLLPRKDLVRVHYYFVFDLLSVYLTSFFVLQKFHWLAIIQGLQHLYYIVFWNKTNPAKKIISWSSLDWIRSKYNSNWEWDSILGTAFDLGVHVFFTYLLFLNLSYAEVFIGTLVALSMGYYVLFSKRYAWANPKKVPAWVDKRIQPLMPWWKDH